MAQLSVDDMKNRPRQMLPVSPPHQTSSFFGFMAGEDSASGTCECPRKLRVLFSLGADGNSSIFRDAGSHVGVEPKARGLPAASRATIVQYIRFIMLRVANDRNGLADDLGSLSEDQKVLKSHVHGTVLLSFASLMGS